MRILIKGYLLLNAIFNGTDTLLGKFPENLKSHMCMTIQVTAFYKYFSVVLFGLHAFKK